MGGVQYINISLDIFCAVISLFVLIFVGMNKYGKVRHNRIFFDMVMVNILLLLTDVVFFAIAGSPERGLQRRLTLLASLLAAYGPILLILLTGLVITTLKNKVTLSGIALWAGYAAVAVCVIDLVCVALTPFNRMYFYIGENNMIVRQNGFMISQSLSFLCLMLNMGILIYHRKALNRRELLTMLSYEVIPMLAVGVHIMVPYFSIINFSITLAMLFYFAGIQSDLSKQIQQKELELTQSRIAVMLSQIQPHFLYNSLTAIAQLCDENPARAKKATINFSAYLRRNMESLTEKGLISFEKEWRHTTGYLDLEKEIYGKALQVSCYIGTRDFMIPSLTLQPLVENAVKHGIGQREGGGTITLTVHETDTEYRIVVADDGVGYDMAEVHPDKDAHIGIDNVRRRMAEQCGGSLEIYSEVGRGTTATLRIPKKEQQRHENTGLG